MKRNFSSAWIYIKPKEQVEPEKLKRIEPVLKEANFFSPEPSKVLQEGMTKIPFSFEVATPKGDGITYYWDFGNGEKLSTTSINTSSDYTAVGTYTVSLTAIDSNDTTYLKIRPDYIKVKSPLGLSFDFNPKIGHDLLNVSFINTTENKSNISKWLWNFDDGTTSALETPDDKGFKAKDPWKWTLIRDSYGVEYYDISLTGVTYDGDEETVFGTLIVYPEIDPKFTASPVIGTTPLTVQFQNLTMVCDLPDWDTNPDGGCTFYWDFGDGGSSTEKHPQYTYTTQGTYTVTLTVTSPYDSKSTTKTDFIIAQEGLNVDFYSDKQSTTLGETIKFFYDGDTSASFWKWEFGDGGVSYYENPSYTYTSPGVYDVKLSINSPFGSGVVSKQDYITILSNLDASPSFDGEVTILEGTTVQFYANVEGSYTSFEWNFDGVNTDNININPSFTFSSPGTYRPQITLTDTLGNSLVRVTPTITVKEKIYVDFTANITTVSENSDITFTPTISGDYYAVSWDFGDNTISTDIEPVKKYSNVGTYTVSLTAHGELEQEIVEKVDYITVVEALNADFTFSPSQGYVPLTVNFTNTSTGSYDYSEWTTNGLSGTIIDTNTSEIYNTTGFKTVSLEISGQGGYDTVTKNNIIQVFEEPSFTLTTNKDNGLTPLEITAHANPSGDYQFINWTWDDNGSAIGESISPTFYNDTENGIIQKTINLQLVKYDGDILSDSKIIDVYRFDVGFEPSVSDFSTTVDITNTSIYPSLDNILFTFEDTDSNGDYITSTNLEPSNSWDALEEYVFTDNIEASASMEPLPSPSAQEIIDNWNKFNHASSSWTTPVDETEYQYWIYDSANDSFYFNLHSGNVNYTYSHKYFEFYTHEARITSDTDDGGSADFESIIIAVHQDPDGTIHTLSAIRSVGGSSLVSKSNVHWALVYNTRRPDEEIIIDNTDTLPISAEGSGWDLEQLSSMPSGYFIKVERDGDNIICRTNTPNQGNPTYLPECDISINLNDYPNLLKFKGAKPYGYSVYSQPHVLWSDITFEGYKISSTNNVYTTDKKWYFDTSTRQWTEDTYSLEPSFYGKRILNSYNGRDYFIDKDTGNITINPNDYTFRIDMEIYSSLVDETKEIYRLINIKDSVKKIYPLEDALIMTGNLVYEDNIWKIKTTGNDETGHLVYGPYQNLSVGSYVVGFEYYSTEPKGVLLGYIDIHDNILGEISRKDIISTGGYGLIGIGFTVDVYSPNYFYEWRVYPDHTKDLELWNNTTLHIKDA